MLSLPYNRQFEGADGRFDFCGAIGSGKVPGMSAVSIQASREALNIFVESTLWEGPGQGAFLAIEYFSIDTDVI